MLAFLDGAGPSNALSSGAVVTSVTFSPDGRILASGSGDTTIRLWDASDPARPAALGNPLHTRHEVSSLAFSPDGRLLVAGDNDNYLNFGDGKGLIQPSAGYGYTLVAFSPDGRTLASGGDGDGDSPGSVQLWDVADPTRPAALGQPLN